MLSRAFSRLSRAPLQAASAKRALSVSAFKRQTEATKTDGGAASAAVETNSEIQALEKMIAERDAHRNRGSWYPFRYTFMIADHEDGSYYYYGGIPGWFSMLAGTLLFGSSLYIYYTYRFFDPYIDHRNPGPDLELYHKYQERLKVEPDFWNWDERDAAKEQEGA